MPRILRWFPVNQDINADPDVWELTDKFGDRALRVWLEILSIADRNDGELPGQWEDYPRILAARCRSTARHIKGVCEWLSNREQDALKAGARQEQGSLKTVASWLQVNSKGVARVVNYVKYHKTRGTNKLPSYPNLPNLPNKERGVTPISSAIPVETQVQHRDQAPPSADADKRNHSSTSKKTSNPEIAVFLAWWVEQHEAILKRKYLVSGGKDPALIKRLLSHVGLVRVKEVALVLLKSRDPWINKRGKTIGTLSACWNSLAGETTDDEWSHLEVWVNCKKCGDCHREGDVCDAVLESKGSV